MTAAHGKVSLFPYAFFGAALAFAGPPIYIHTPSLYANQHGLSLAAVGTVLLALRFVDFAQDPLLGWWLARAQASRRKLAAGFALLLGLGALALFAPALPIDAGWWLAISLAAVFTGFSALQILFYSAGVSLAQQPGNTHDKVAGWREAGILAGVCAACVAPSLTALAVGSELAFGLFALGFCAFLAVAVWRMRSVWPARGEVSDADSLADPGGFRPLLADPGVRRLLVIGTVNALPTGVTATLFVFFVEDRLQTPVHTGPMLLLFFLAAAIAAPLWARAAERIGAKWAMLIGMSAAVAAFLWTLTLGPGDWVQFYVISFASGAALGADMTLLPAMLARRVSGQALSSERAFGLWGFINKASLAIAAGTALPALDAAGFMPGKENTESAVSALSWAYAGAPCALKACAAALLLFLHRSEDKPG